MAEDINKEEQQLADGKQKKWWHDLFNKGCAKWEGCDKPIPDKYRFDYVAALVCHALYWSIVVCAPFYASPWFIWAVVANTAVHAAVDDLKANSGVLNLVQDQSLHVVQIIATFFTLY